MSRKVTALPLAMLVLAGAMRLKPVVAALGTGTAIMAANGPAPAPRPSRNGPAPAPRPSKAVTVSR